MGKKWPGSQPVITWSFAENAASDQDLRRNYSDYPAFEAVFDASQKQLVRGAFQAWEDAANIDFVELIDYSAAKIRIGWDSIDGNSRNGGILGQTTVWATHDILTQAAIQMDFADTPEAYYGKESLPSHSWSFYTTVLHEIGHALGLNHSSSSSTLMYARAGSVADLTADDIAGLVALYGQPQRSPHSTLTLASLEKGVDPAMYLTVNQDVAFAGIDPALHFNNFGWRESRNPNTYFDVHFYLNANPDVRAANINPLEHYLQYGWKEHRDPSTHFDTTSYLDANPDVRLAGVNPLVHYLVHGMGEGRSWA